MAKPGPRLGSNWETFWSGKEGKNDPSDHPLVDAPAGSTKRFLCHNVHTDGASLSDEEDSELVQLQ